MSIDTSVWDSLVARISTANGGVEVGIFDEAEAAIAIHHEFGAPAINLPQRSFLRSTLIEREQEYVALAANLSAKLIAGSITHAQATGLLGAWAQGAIKAQITHLGDFAPVTAATQQRKGLAYTRPLIRQNGNLVGSIKIRTIVID